MIIADEPLDVVVQRQVMETLKTLGKALGASIILIGHDMGLMAQAVDRLGVMYAGRPVETGSVEECSAIPPVHPVVDCQLADPRPQGGITGIPGLTPSLLNRPERCPFQPRCPVAFDRCKTEEPLLREARPKRARSRAILREEGAAPGRS